MPKRVKIVFFGDVKDNGYRFFIKQKAIELKLKGFCHLNEQGRLEVEVEGETNAVDEFIAFVQRGVSIQAEQTGFELSIFDELKGYKTMTSDIV